MRTLSTIRFVRHRELKSEGLFVGLGVQANARQAELTPNLWQRKIVSQLSLGDHGLDHFGLMINGVERLVNLVLFTIGKSNSSGAIGVQCLAHGL